MEKQNSSDIPKNNASETTNSTLEVSREVEAPVEDLSDKTLRQSPVPSQSQKLPPHIRNFAQEEKQPTTRSKTSRKFAEVEGEKSTRHQINKSAKYSDKLSLPPQKMKLTRNLRPQTWKAAKQQGETAIRYFS